MKKVFAFLQAKFQLLMVLFITFGALFITLEYLTGIKVFLHAGIICFWVIASVFSYIFLRMLWRWLS